MIAGAAKHGWPRHSGSWHFVTPQETWDESLPWYATQTADPGAEIRYG